MKQRDWKRLVALFLVACLLAAPPPATALADDAKLPTGSSDWFFANGTPVTISESAPQGGEEAYFSGFTIKGTSAYLSWEEGGRTKYIGVSSGTCIAGGM